MRRVIWCTGLTYGATEAPHAEVTKKGMNDSSQLVKLAASHTDIEMLYLHSSDGFHFWGFTVR